MHSDITVDARVGVHDLPLPLLRSSRTSGLSCPWSLMGDQLGTARALSIAWAQLWLICLYLESLASFVQAGESPMARGKNLRKVGRWGKKKALIK